MSSRQFHALDQGISDIVFLAGILLGRNLKFSQMVSPRTALAWGTAGLHEEWCCRLTLGLRCVCSAFLSCCVFLCCTAPPAFPASCRGCCVGLQQAFVLLSNKCSTASTASCPGQRNHLEKLCVRNNTLFLSSV